MEIITENENGKEFNDLIQHLNGILQDRNIPEQNKILIRKKFEELMKLKNITDKRKIIISKEEYLKMLPL